MCETREVNLHPMASTVTTKLLTFVFEDDAPLPTVQRWSLADGLYLSSIPLFLLTQDDDYHVLAVRPNFSRFCRDHLHGTALNVEYEGRTDLNYEGVKSAEAEAKQTVNNYLLAAMLHSPHFLAPHASFVTMPDTEKICHSDRMKDFGRFDKTHTSTLKKADFNAIDRLFTVVSNILTSGQSGRLPTAIRYYQQAFRTDIDWSVRFLGMMMAMESLFSHGAASEVSHQVSERTAFFLKKGSRKRESLYEEMKKHYGLRSTIAHGGSSTRKGNDMTRAFGELLLIVRASLLKVLGDSNLTDIFQTASATALSKSLRNLVFREKIELSDDN